MSGPYRINAYDPSKAPKPEPTPERKYPSRVRLCACTSCLFFCDNEIADPYQLYCLTCRDKDHKPVAKARWYLNGKPDPILE